MLLSSGVRLVTGPTDLAVTLDEAKLATKNESTSENTFLTDVLKAAIQQVELDTDLKLMPQTWELTFDAFDDVLIVPFTPVISVTSIKYDDEDDTEQTLSSSRYYSRLTAAPARILPVPEQAWPATSQREGSVRVSVQCGFANAASVPVRAKQAVYMLFGHWAEHRGLSTTRSYTDISFAYQSLTIGLRRGMV